MQCYSLIYSDNEKLKAFIAQHNLQAHHSILIQVFTGINEYTYIENLRQTLLTLLPQAKIIGTTTSGEI